MEEGVKGRRNKEQDAVMPSISISAILPTELQKLILPHLDRASFANLRATDRHYRDLVTRDSPSLWRAHHDARWPNGKRRIRTRVARWSRLRGWRAHPEDVADDAGGEEDWHGEYVRRSRLDRTVPDRLAALLDSRRHGPAWRALMADGEDAVDAVRAVVLDPARFASSATSSAGDAAAALGAAGRRALVGIGRCAAYQEWRSLHEPVLSLDLGPDPPARVEDGAVALAKFYGGRDAAVPEAGRAHAWEEYVFRELDALAGVVRERLDDDRRGAREGEGPDRAILEVVKAMRCLFSPDEDRSLPCCFSGNVGDYYNHRNSLIDHCLSTRKGIPITLAVIYVAIVRRVCGVEMDIIGMPGHIVVGVPPDEADGSPRLFVDPFHEAKMLTLSDCQAIVERYNIAFTDAMVRPIPNEEVWQRMVRNLIVAINRQVMANDGGAEADSTQVWKMAIPLRQLLSDYASRITNFRELVAAPGFSLQFC